MRQLRRVRRLPAAIGVFLGLLAWAETQALAAQPNPFEQRVAQAVRLQLRRDIWTAEHTGTHGGLALQPFLLDESTLITGKAWPLKVLLRTPGESDAGSADQQKRLSFDLEVSFTKLLPAFRAEQLTFFCDGHVNLGKEGKLVYRHPDKTPFPLGASGLALYGYEITFCPHANRASIQADLSTIPGDPRLLRLRGTITVMLPVQKIEFAGKLLVGDAVLGTITDAEISKTMVQGTLNLLAESKVLPCARAQFRLDRTGLVATGDVTFLKVFRKQLELSLAWDGQGHFQSSKDLHLPGLKTQSALSTSFGPGAGQLHFQARTSAGVHVGSVQHEIRLGFAVQPYTSK